MMSFCGGLAPTKCSKQLSHRVSACKQSVTSSSLTRHGLSVHLRSARLWAGGHSSLPGCRRQSPAGLARVPPPPPWGPGQGCKTESADADGRPAPVRTSVKCQKLGANAAKKRGVSRALGRGPSAFHARVAQGTCPGAEQSFGCFLTQQINVWNRWTSATISCTPGKPRCPTSAKDTFSLLGFEQKTQLWVQGPGMELPGATWLGAPSRQGLGRPRPPRLPPPTPPHYPPD